VHAYLRPMTGPAADAGLDRALISELNRMIKVIVRERFRAMHCSARCKYLPSRKLPWLNSF
jgi:hypothetical protein